MTPRLGFADSEHLGSALGTSTLGCRFTILHFDSPGIAHLSLGPALHTIGLHRLTSLL